MEEQVFDYLEKKIVQIKTLELTNFSITQSEMMLLSTLFLIQV